MNSELFITIVQGLGTVETHFLASGLFYWIHTKFKPKSRFAKLLKLSLILYILSLMLLVNLHKPFHSENVFRLTGLKRGQTSEEDIENMLGRLEDKYIDDESKQDYIIELEEKLKSSGKNYLLKSDDLFGDQFQGLSFDGRISTQKSFHIMISFAKFIIMLYSIMTVFPAGTGKPLKLFAITLMAGCSYVCYLLYEPSLDQEKTSQMVKNEIFKFEIFEQFAVFNVVALIEGVSSFLLMLILNLAFWFRPDKRGQVLRKVEEGLDQNLTAEGFETSLEKVKKLKDHLRGLIDKKGKKIRANVWYLKVLVAIFLVFTVGIKVAIFYELID